MVLENFFSIDFIFFIFWVIISIIISRQKTFSNFLIKIIHLCFDIVVENIFKIFNHSEFVTSLLECDRDNDFLLIFDIVTSVHDFSFRTHGIISNTIQQKPTLVMGLDKTLIFSTTQRGQTDCDFYMFDEDSRKYIYVYMRPHVTQFLNIVSKYYEVVIYTKSFSCYVDPILDHIDKKRVISKRLYNTSLVKTQYSYEKRLYMANSENTPKQIILVDNSPTVCITDHDNLYLIPAYRPFLLSSSSSGILTATTKQNAGLPDDDELLKLLMLLVLIQRSMTDFTKLLGRRDAFTRPDIK